jgi:signal transduction histidine kinase
MPNLKFTVDSALLRELGEKLVETVHLALIELVKNAYDADASEVRIIFDTDSEGNTQIIVKDNGIGMSFEAVQNYWMRIATNNKEERDVSRVYKRPLTGAKGIGRFCCRRLGSHLQLITKGTSSGRVVGKQRRIEETIVNFPWDEFLPGTDVTEIECEGEEVVKANESTGTTLIISKISDEWNARGFNWLKRQLAVLAANAGSKRGDIIDPGFKILLDVPDFEGGVRDLREDLINAGWGTLKAYINSKGQAVCELNALGLGRKTITSTQRFSNLSDIALTLGIMVDVRTQMRDTSVLSQGTLQQILPDWGGVQVRFKGFRVFPYGDDDWLEIDHDRGLRKGAPVSELQSFAETLRGVDASRSLLNMLSMRSYVGNVNIGEGAAGFEMKLNREGFIDSASVRELKEFVRFAIQWVTILRDFYIRQESMLETVAAKERLEDVLNEKIEVAGIVDAAVGYLEKEVISLTKLLDPKERKSVETTFYKATDAIRKFSESNRLELSHLRVIASTSTLLLIFSHEVKSLLGLIEQSNNSLRIIANYLKGMQKSSVNEIVNDFSDLKNRLNELLELTKLIGTDQRKSKPGLVALKERIIRVEKVFELIVRKYNIEIDYSLVPNNIMLSNMLEAEVYSILLNVVSNSIKSVIAGGKNRKISIIASRKNGFNEIIVKDSGIGLQEERFEEVFIPFISDPEGKLYQKLENRLNPEDKMIVGTGSGLGLGIVKEIVRAHNGSIRFIKPEKNWSAELEIKLP